MTEEEMLVLLAKDGAKRSDRKEARASLELAPARDVLTPPHTSCDRPLLHILSS